MRIVGLLATVALSLCLIGCGEAPGSKGDAGPAGPVRAKAKPDPRVLPALRVRQDLKDLKGPQGQQGRKGPRRSAKVQPRRSVSCAPIAMRTGCSVACNADEVVLTAFCGAKRAPATFPDRATGVLPHARHAKHPARCGVREGLRRGHRDSWHGHRPRPPPSPASHRAAGGVPSFDVGSTCRATAADVMIGTPGTCMADEESARAELAKGWTRFPPAERTRCTELSGMRGFQSYVELITCLEMAGDAAKIPHE